MGIPAEDSVRLAAVTQVRGGRRPVDVARSLSVSPTSVYSWLHADAPALVRRAEPCCRCADPPRLPADPRAYAQLLGLYLGDGCVSAARNGVQVLRVTCDDAWPGVAAECAQVLEAVSGNRVQRAAKQGCHDVQAYSKHWLCLFPQHGPGKKHERSIELEPWQEEVVAEHPGRLLRGLFHSDGWRGDNVAVHRKEGLVVRYRYSRYEFTNYSPDIRRICTDALDRLEIAWRPNGPFRISVNRRAAVAALDEHVGPKT